MTTQGFFFKLAHRLSPGAWLAVAVIMALLATGSGWVLYSRLDEKGKDRLVLAYESIGPFWRETWRLTFERKKEGSAELAGAIRIAPVGTLDPDASFVWVTHFSDFVSLPEDEAFPEPLAPVRLLDPEWNPAFSPR